MKRNDNVKDYYLSSSVLLNVRVSILAVARGGSQYAKVPLLCPQTHYL